jgi:hypothetical protein
MFDVCAAIRRSSFKFGVSGFKGNLVFKSNQAIVFEIKKPEIASFGFKHY